MMRFKGADFGAGPEPMMMEMARANEMHIVEDAMMMDVSV